MQTDLITAYATKNNITLSPNQLNQLTQLQQEVLETNKTMNLTAITDPTDFAIKHIIDSLTLIPFISDSSDVIDVGTGAGFPGVVLKIAKPDIKITLLDSTQKRIKFLQKMVDKLSLSSVQCIHARAEEYAKKHSNFDICTARAVARFDTLAGYTLPLVKQGGLVLAMKGPDVSVEINDAKPIIKKLGGKVRQISVVEISPDIRHSIILVDKIK